LPGGQSAGSLWLGKEADVAVRPVHIRNVGLGVSEPLDAYWKAIYQMVGVTDTRITVESYIDQQKILAYFNTHAFAIDPYKGLLRGWHENFEKLVCDEAFQSGACYDELHQVFLHQAVFSALITANLTPDRIRLLPPQYNYPYNLHASINPERQARSFNDLVSFTYEDRDLHPTAIDDIKINEPLRTWLANSMVTAR
jgi:hypothetical protein